MVSGRQVGASPSHRVMVGLLRVGRRVPATERFSMLKALMIALGVCTLVLTANAADDAKSKKQPPPMTEEQKAVNNEMLKKYDKNKDGKLDGEERKAMTAEDRDKMGKAFGWGKKKQEPKK
jgi:hypothetical protein